MTARFFAVAQNDIREVFVILNPSTLLRINSVKELRANASQPIRSTQRRLMVHEMEFLKNNSFDGLKRQAAVAEGLVIFHDPGSAGAGCDETQGRTPSCHPP